MADYQAERLSAAKVLGKYSIEYEWDLVLDEVNKQLSYKTTFDEFQDWIRGFMYYSALVCASDTFEELETQLRDDYEEVMRGFAESAPR